MWGSLRAAASRLRMGNNPSTVGLSNAATVNKIQETISDNCVVIFSKTTCSYCKMAKKLFQDMNVNYTAVELDMYENGSQFQDILHQMTGGRTNSSYYEMLQNIRLKILMGRAHRAAASPACQLSVWRSVHAQIAQTRLFRVVIYSPLVPRVFINGAFIGGATDTQRLHQEGKLLPLVHQCQMRRAKHSDFPCSLP